MSYTPTNIVGCHGIALSSNNYYVYISDYNSYGMAIVNVYNLLVKNIKQAKLLFILFNKLI